MSDEEVPKSQADKEQTGSPAAPGSQAAEDETPTGSDPGSATTASGVDDKSAPPVNSSGPPADGTVPPGDSSAPPGDSSAAQTSAGSSKTSTASKRRGKNEKATMANCRIGFLGAGKMTEAIVKGLIQHSKVEPSRIFVSSPSGRTHDLFKQLGCTVTKRAYDIFAKHDCDVIFFAFHGFVIRQLYKTGGTRPMALTTNYIPNQRHPIFMLSLVGGVPLNDIKNTLLNPEHPEKYKIEMHRIMLNTSVAYGLGLGALDIEPDSKKCNPLVRDVLTSFARIECIPEASMDVACAVGGNGLAYCHFFITALSDGGFKMGLPKSIAVKLAAKTLQSASASLLESGKHPSDLRDSSTSPSGPAIYGLHILDKQDAGSGIAGAVEGAFKRIRELVEQAK